ncbi:MAG: alpha-amylase [Cyclobacteriaceae bacterium]|nr:alpha-amylase [Cyclobacteriaceae bacterium HetDA_MAG_MS6]
MPQIIYQIFIPSFADANGDGIGDLNGITERLDYLYQLGVDCLWLSPIHPSPSYHKYDVVDYFEIDQDFGTLKDFEHLINEAHRRQIKVLMDLVINHCSVQHYWFQQAKKGATNSYHSYFKWATSDEIGDRLTKAVSEDSDNIYQWHSIPGIKEKYSGFFWEGMADLNLSNPSLRMELFDIAKFWLRKGIDGFRIDAVKHMFPNELEKGLSFWKQFRKEMEMVNPDVHLIGEVWDTAKNIYPYLDVMDVFDFEFSEVIRKAVLQEASTQFVKKYLQVQSDYSEESSYSPVSFLGNHDQERIRSGLGNNTAKAKLVASILLSLPGKVCLYYGEEIGMLGMKPDPHIREPFPWGEADSCQTSSLLTWYSTHHKVTPLSKQLSNEESIYHHYRKWIYFRKYLPAIFKTGELQKAPIEDDDILAYYLTGVGQQLLVIHNLDIRKKTIHINDINFKKIIFTSQSLAKISGDQLALPAYTSLVLTTTQNTPS